MDETERNRSLVTEAFAAWAGGDGGAFFRLLADDVRWTVIGTTPISGTYTSRRSFLDEAAGRLTEKLASGIAPTLVSVLADGDRVSVQWEGRAESTEGTPYDQRYSWVMRLADGKVVEGTAYLDTELVSTILAE